MKPRDWYILFRLWNHPRFSHKNTYRTKYGMGTGKAQEIEEFVKESQNIDIMIIDEHLSSKQTFKLE
jgi:GTP-binding protein HflX